MSTSVFILESVSTINPGAFNYTVTGEPMTATDVSNLTTANYDKYKQGPVALFLWSLVYGLVVLFGLAGNIGICWIIFSIKKMRTVTNFFLCSTAFADCNVIALNTIFNFTYASNGIWYFGRGFCHFINFVPIGAVMASILSITTISVDRLLLVMYPLRERTSKKKAKITIASIWAFSLLLAFPQAYFATTAQGDEPRKICKVQFPNKTIGLSYHATFMVLSYWLPLFILVTSYLTMGVRLLAGYVQIIGNQNETQRKRAMKNKKAVKMMALVVIVFALFWLPYHLYFLITIISKQLIKETETQQIYLTVFLLAMSSALWNPIIYCWANKRFRKAFKQMLTRPSANSIDNGQYRTNRNRTSRSSEPDSRTVQIPLATIVNN